MRGSNKLVVLTVWSLFFSPPSIVAAVRTTALLWNCSRCFREKNRVLHYISTWEDKAFTMGWLNLSKCCLWRIVLWCLIIMCGESTIQWLSFRSYVHALLGAYGVGVMGFGCMNLNGAFLWGLPVSVYVSCVLLYTNDHIFTVCVCVCMCVCMWKIVDMFKFDNPVLMCLS